MSDFLPYGRQVIDEDDIAAVAAVLRSDFLTTGPAVAAFERAFAVAVGSPFAVSCSSATAGLHLAAMAAELGEGQFAIVPSNTFLATANAVRYVGADVVFADVDPTSGLMRPSDLREAMSRAPGPVKAIFPVHFAGQCEDMAEIRSLAQEIGALVIEDACHALGARDSDGSPIGACVRSDMAVFSFHPVKTLAMGEGGAVTTRDPVLAERLSRLRSHGMVRDPAAFTNKDLGFGPDGSANPWYYEMPSPGFNYRASDVHCALGLSQLRKLRRFVDRRRSIVAEYRSLLEGVSPSIRLLRETGFCDPAWHLLVALIDFEALGVERGSVMRTLQAMGVGTQVHYVPVPYQPYYQGLYGMAQYSGVARYYEQCLSLPLFPSMSDADVRRVVDALKKALMLS